MPAFLVYPTSPPAFPLRPLQNQPSHFFVHFFSSPPHTQTQIKILHLRNDTHFNISWFDKPFFFASKPIFFCACDFSMKFSADWLASASLSSRKKLVYASGGVSAGMYGWIREIFESRYLCNTDDGADTVRPNVLSKHIRLKKKNKKIWKWYYIFVN